MTTEEKGEEGDLGNISTPQAAGNPASSLKYMNNLKLVFGTMSSFHPSMEISPFRKNPLFVIFLNFSPHDYLLLLFQKLARESFWSFRLQLLHSPTVKFCLLDYYFNRISPQIRPLPLEENVGEGKKKPIAESGSIKFLSSYFSSTYIYKRFHSQLSSAFSACHSGIFVLESFL